MNKYPITPPPELVQQWADRWKALPDADDVCLFSYIANQSARWGADQELEACCAYLQAEIDPLEAVHFRATRRPQPSLKEQALTMLDNEIGLNAEDVALLRRALESLPEGPTVTPDLAIESESDVYNNIPVATDEELSYLYDSIAMAHLLSLRAIYDLGREHGAQAAEADLTENS